MGDFVAGNFGSIVFSLIVLGILWWKLNRLERRFDRNAEESRQERQQLFSAQVELKNELSGLRKDFSGLRDKLEENGTINGESDRTG